MNPDLAPAQQVFLGVDGGGTKTALCLVDATGRLLARVRAPSTYYASGDVDLVARVLADGVAAVCARAGVTTSDVTRAFVGLPGYGEVRADLAAVDAIVAGVLGHDRYNCGNDAVGGWAGSLAAADGINIVAGTGSVGYGERAGRGARAGGWGELIGDEGSGYWIALRGLAAFSRMSDGRLPTGPLLGVLREHLGLVDDLDLVYIVHHRWRGRRREIAALSRQVVHAGELGDEQCRCILTAAGAELVALVVATRRRLGFERGETVPVSWSGSIFGVQAVRTAFSAGLATLDDGYELRAPQFEPVIGAALYAARLAGRALPAASLERLHAG